MSEARLISPHRDYAISYAEALREGLYPDEDITAEAALVESDFDTWITDKMDMNKPVSLPDGTFVKKVPASYFWLVTDSQFLGAVSLRHELNDNLMRFGGHIGYSVRPGERRKGYASLMLRETLAEARKLNLHKVLVTCSDDNFGSIGAIEKNGGILEDKVHLSFQKAPERRYWIKL